MTTIIAPEMVRSAIQPLGEKKETATIWFQTYFKYGDQHPKNGTVIIIIVMIIINYSAYL